MAHTHALSAFGWGNRQMTRVGSQLRSTPCPLPSPTPLLLPPFFATACSLPTCQLFLSTPGHRTSFVCGGRPRSLRLASGGGESGSYPRPTRRRCRNSPLTLLPAPAEGGPASGGAAFFSPTCPPSCFVSAGTYNHQQHARKAPRMAVKALEVLKIGKPPSSQQTALVAPYNQRHTFAQ